MDKHARESPRKVGNHTFTLTEDHLSPDEIQLLKLQFDERSSAALQRLQEIYKDQSAAKSTPDGLTRLDLYAVLRDNHKTNPVLASLWDEMYTVPSWVDWDQIDRGQRVFYRYGVANMIGFALQGFMGENAASPGIAEVLVRTGGFSTSVVLRRAVETFQWLLQVTRSVEDIKPGGEGHISTTRVRLLHASVRARVTKLAESKPDYLDVEKYGLPVNSLDDIHSIALFACNPMWLQLPVMGVNPRSDEIDDYVALFRYIGYLLAVPDRFFATTKAARMTMEAMCVYERRPTEASAVLCHNFIQALADVPPFNISAGFVEAGARVVNGDELSDAEGIGKPGWLSYVEFRGFCWLAQLLTAVQRIFPSFDNYVIKLQRYWLYWYLVESGGSKFSLGGPTKFEMKHQPRIGSQTKKEANKGQASRPRFIIIRPLESLFMTVFVLGCSFVLSMIFLAWTVARITFPQLPSPGMLFFS